MFLDNRILTVRRKAVWGNSEARNFRLKKSAPLVSESGSIRYLAMHWNSSTMIPIVLFRTKPF